MARNPNHQGNRPGSTHDALIAAYLAEHPDIIRDKIRRRLLPEGFQGCAVWPGGLDRAVNGIPRMKVGNLSTSVWRVLLVADGRPPGEGRMSTTCGNLRCCAMAHLRITQQIRP